MFSSIRQTLSQLWQRPSTDANSPQPSLIAKLSNVFTGFAGNSTNNSLSSERSALNQLSMHVNVSQADVTAQLQREAARTNNPGATAVQSPSSIQQTNDDNALFYLKGGYRMLPETVYVTPNTTQAETMQLAYAGFADKANLSEAGAQEFVERRMTETGGKVYPPQRPDLAFSDKEFAVNTATGKILIYATEADIRLLNEIKMREQAALEPEAPSMSARSTTAIEGAVNTVTDTLDSTLGTDPNSIGGTLNRMAVSGIRVLGDAAETIGADETANTLKNAGSEATRQDDRTNRLIEQTGYEKPLMAQVQQDLQYLPEQARNAADTIGKGDFSDKQGTGAFVGRIVGGANPLGDVRDVTANAIDVANNKKGSYVGLGGAVLGTVIPGGGDAAKAVIRAEKEAITEGIEAALKQTDEVAEQVTETTIKTAEQEAAEKAAAKTGKLEIEAGRTLSVEEQRIADKLVAEGKEVKVPKEIENQAGVRNPDFEIDGVKTELKTISNIKKTDPDGLSAKLSQRITEATSQGSDVIIDATEQAGMTKDVAELGIKRAFGRWSQLGSNKITNVRIIGKDFDISQTFNK